MSYVQKIFMTSLAFLLLTACGLKGDLYLPEAQPQVVDTPTTSVEESTEGTEEQSSLVEEEIQEIVNQESPEL